MKVKIKTLLTATVIACGLMASLTTVSAAVYPLPDPLEGTRITGMPLFIDECNNTGKIWSSTPDITQISISDSWGFNDKGNDKTLMPAKTEWPEITYKIDGTINDIVVFGYVAYDINFAIYVSPTGEPNSWVELAANQIEQVCKEATYKEKCWYVSEVDGAYSYVRIALQSNTDAWQQRLSEVRIGYTPSIPAKITGTVTDEGTDFSLLNGKRSNIGIIGGNYYKMDNINDNGYITYESPGGQITSITAENICYEGVPALNFYVSKDRINWKQIAQEAIQQDGTVFTCSDVPEGNRYLKVEFASWHANGTANWMDLITNVSYTYDPGIAAKNLMFHWLADNSRGSFVDHWDRFNGTLNLSAELHNGTAEQIKPTMLVAEYDASGKLLRVTKQQFGPVIPGYEQRVEMEFSRLEETTKATAFVWDEETLYPLCNTVGFATEGVV